MPGTLRIGGGNVGTAGGSAVSASRRASCCLSGGGLLDGFLAMADAGVELAAPAPRVEAVLLSSPPFLTLLSTSLDAGLLSIIKSIT